MANFSTALFKNDRKETEKQPDYTGLGDITKEEFLAIYDQVMQNRCNFTADGKIKLRIAGWKRESNAGKPYISLLLSVDDYQVAAKPAAPAPAQPDADLF